MRSVVLVVLLGGLGLLATATAEAAVVRTFADGKLTGASGVVVNGQTYSVEFLDGTCLELFAGCDNPAQDFRFTDQAAAQAASQALLDQVFLDVTEGNFDTSPGLTRGCSTFWGFCRALTPFGFEYGSPLTILVYAAENHADPVNDQLGIFSLGPSYSTGGTDYLTFARWTAPAPVPLPPAVALFGAALGALAWLRRRQVDAAARR